MLLKGTYVANQMFLAATPSKGGTSDLSIFFGEHVPDAYLKLFVKIGDEEAAPVIIFLL